MNVQEKKTKKKQNTTINITLDREATRFSNSKNTGLNEPKVKRPKTSSSVSTPNSVDHQ